MPSYAYPPPPPSIDPTPLEECDRIVEKLRAHKDEWAALSIPERIGLLDQLRERLVMVQERWVAKCQQAKGIDPDTSLAGEDWLAGPVVTQRNIRLLRAALIETEANGQPKVNPRRVSQRADGRTVVEVFPGDIYDKLLYAGFTAEVWMQPGVTPENLVDHMATSYKSRPESGLVSLVLGAGNVSSIPPMDAIYKLFIEHQVVVLKMNPVNEYLGPIFEEAFKPFIDRGFFAVVYGAVEVGAHLCQHPQVDTLHITGSDATHDAIVWGPPAGREERKRSGNPVNTKPISSELGNVTPIIVVPGQWSESELNFQAQNIATMVCNNGSFNCNAAKLLVVAQDWELRDAFITRVKTILSEQPNRKAYYPGAANRWKIFCDAHPDHEKLTAESPETVPWTFIGGLDANDQDEICFRQEPFCGVLHEVSLPGKTTVDFLPGAVDFVNDRVWGTLAVSMLVHPSSRKGPAAEACFQEALDNLRYGSIGINHWAALAYALCTTTWGAYPGHTLEDIQSGRDVVHNTLMFDKPQKSVVHGPFTVFPKPPWFVTHKNTNKIGPRVAKLEVQPSLFKVPAIALYAMLG
jgi:hypothetical protein